MIYRRRSVFQNINVVYYTLSLDSRAGFYDSYRSIVVILKGERGTLNDTSFNGTGEILEPRRD